MENDGNGSIGLHMTIEQGSLGTRQAVFPGLHRRPWKDIRHLAMEKEEVVFSVVELIYNIYGGILLVYLLRALLY